MDTGSAIIAYVLAESDRADREAELRDAAWRAGWRACQQAQDDAYEAGYADGILLRKRAQHATVRELAVELRRWDGRREDFGQPRPTDIQPAGRRAGAA